MRAKSTGVSARPNPNIMIPSATGKPTVVNDEPMVSACSLSEIGIARIFCFDIVSCGGIVSGAHESRRSMPPMVQAWRPRPEAGFAKSARFDQPHHPMPVAAPRLQQFQHAVVIDRPADQRPPHQRRQVVVADADVSGSPCARCTVSAAVQTPMPATVRSAEVTAVRPGPFDGSLQTGGDPDRPADRRRPARVDTREMPFPGRDPAPFAGRTTRIPAGAGPGPDSEFGDQLEPGLPGVGADHPLLQHGGHQRFEDQAVRGIRRPGTARRVRCSSGCDELSNSDQSSRRRAFPAPVRPPSRRRPPGGGFTEPRVRPAGA